MRYRVMLLGLAVPALVLARQPELPRFRYVSMSGADHLQKPLIEMMAKVIGPDDMIGALTPEMPPSAITYGRRTKTIEQLVTEWRLFDEKSHDRRGVIRLPDDSVIPRHEGTKNTKYQT